MKYDFVLIDKIFCESFVKWTYEENNNTSGRTGLFEIHLRSAIRKSNEEKCILIMTSATREELERQYINDVRNMCHLSSIVEASDEIKVPICLDEIEAVLKSASWLKWKKISFCILTGNSLLHDMAKKNGFDVHYLQDADIVLKQL